MGLNSDFTCPFRTVPSAFLFAHIFSLFLLLPAMGKGSPPPPSPAGSGVSGKEEAKLVAQAHAKAGELASGSKHFILPSSWFKQWQSFCKDADSTKPGPIDNSSLLWPTKEAYKDKNSLPSTELEPQLKPNLSENEDYQIVTEPEWKLLHDWYGGGPVIERPAITEGKEKEVVRVEVYLMLLEAVLTNSNGSPDLSSSRLFYFSKKTPLKDVVRLISEYFKARGNAVRLWDWEDENDTTSSKCRLISDWDPTLEDGGLIHGQKVILEKSLGQGKWPRDKMVNSNATPQNAPSSDSSDQESTCFGCFPKGKSKRKGRNKVSTKPNDSKQTGNRTGNSEKDESGPDTNDTLFDKSKAIEFRPCGLRNLGNTCFLNAAVQCLSNTSPLRNYFLEGKFKSEINEKNVMGTQGQLAKQYAALMRAMWSGENPTYAPKTFKQTLTRFAPQFEGFNQHDAQEFLAFLLDGVGEDLSRIPGRKPYVETKEANGRPDKEVALEAWQGHLKRNSSIIVDLFHGQLKSTVTCPECGRVSETFDPFMYLSLPLQQETSRNIEISFWGQDSFERGTKYSVKVPRGGKVSDVRKELGKVTGMKPKNIILTQMSESKILRIFDDTEDTAQFGFSGVFMAYEFPNGGIPTKRTTNVVQVLHRLRHGRKPASSAFTSPSYGHGWTFQMIGLPFVLELKNGVTTGRQLYELIWNKCSRFILFPTVASDSSSSDSAGEEDSDEEAKVAPNKQDQKNQKVASDSKTPSKTQTPSATQSATDKAKTDDKTAKTDNTPDLNHKDAQRGSKSAKETDESSNNISNVSASKAIQRPSITQESSTTQVVTNAESTASKNINNGDKNSESDESKQSDPSAESSSTKGTSTNTTNITNSNDQLPSVTADSSSNNLSSDSTNLNGNGNGDNSSISGSNGNITNNNNSNVNINGKIPSTASPVPKTAKTKPKKKSFVPTYLDGSRLDTYPFKIHFTNSHGTSCGICGEACDGCLLQPTDNPIFYGNPGEKVATLTIEWSMTVHDQYYVKDLACAVTRHPTLDEARAATKKAEATLNLEECLNMFTVTERLSENDPWYCPSCQVHQCAWKKMELWKLPEILIVHLKRFCYSPTHRSKLHCLVSFPIEQLNLDPFIINPDERGYTYDLYAIANHVGVLAGGHYTAYAKRDTDQVWYAFDDTNVTPVKVSNITTPAAYLLFYKRNLRATKQEDPTIEVDPTLSADASSSSKPSKHSKKKTKSSAPQQTAVSASSRNESKSES